MMVMASLHRKLMEVSILRNSMNSKFINETTPDICVKICASSEEETDLSCPSPCLSWCPLICKHPIDVSPPTPPYHPPDSSKPQTWLIIMISLIAFTFLISCAYAFYRNYYLQRRRRSEQPPEEETAATHEEFLDEEHGPVLDHHIWYIRTVGLHQSVISAINIFKYKKGDGLVEGTECSVCLSEFQEDETLRLLPKCSHAFHIPCIDTWLTSHTNCPMCRAPIVIAAATAIARPPAPVVSAAGGGENSNPAEENQVGVLDRSREVEVEAEMGGEIEVIGSEDEEEVRNDNSWDEIGENGIQGRRRSVSFDPQSGSEINVFDVSKVGAKRVGNKKLKKVERTSSMERSLQSRPVSMKRSVSCHGKFALCREKQNSESKFPLRSI